MMATLPALRACLRGLIVYLQVSWCLNYYEGEVSPAVSAHHSLSHRWQLV